MDAMIVRMPVVGLVALHAQVNVLETLNHQIVLIVLIPAREYAIPLVKEIVLKVVLQPVLVLLKVFRLQKVTDLFRILLVHLKPEIMQ